MATVYFRSTIFILVILCLLVFQMVNLVLTGTEYSVQAKTLHDPTRPPGVKESQGRRYTEKKRSAWRLSSTLIAPDRRIATINGKLIQTGEHINGAMLIDIQRWNVTLQKKNKKFKVYMFKKVQKKISR